jgi:hypothetical protein
MHKQTENIPTMIVALDEEDDFSDQFDDLGNLLGGTPIQDESKNRVPVEEGQQLANSLGASFAQYISTNPVAQLVSDLIKVIRSFETGSYIYSALAKTRDTGGANLTQDLSKGRRRCNQSEQSIRKYRICS